MVCEWYHVDSPMLLISSMRAKWAQLWSGRKKKYPFKGPLHLASLLEHIKPPDRRPSTQSAQSVPSLHIAATITAASIYTAVSITASISATITDASIYTLLMHGLATEADLASLICGTEQLYTQTQRSC